VATGIGGQRSAGAAGLARAEIETRIRVAEDQEIVVLARDSGGKVWRASAAVKVVHGGCRG